MLQLLPVDHHFRLHQHFQMLQFFLQALLYLWRQLDQQDLLSLLLLRGRWVLLLQILLFFLHLPLLLMLPSPLQDQWLQLHLSH